MNSTTTTLLLLKRHNDVELGKEGQRARKNCISIIAILQKKHALLWLLPMDDIYLVHAQDTPSSMESLFRIDFKSAAYQICEAGAWLQFENVALTQKEQSTRSCLAILKLSWMPFAFIFSRRLFWHLGLSNISMRVRGIKWKRVLSKSGASGGRSTIFIITNFVIQTPLFSSYKNKHDKTIHHHCRKLLHSSTCSPFPPSPHPFHLLLLLLFLRLNVIFLRALLVTIWTKLLN